MESKISELSSLLLITYSGLHSHVAISQHRGVNYLISILKSLESYEERHKVPEFELALNKYIEGKCGAHRCLINLDKALFQIIENTEEVDWETVSHSLGNQHQFTILREFGNKMSDEDYWRIVNTCYTMSDFAHTESGLIESYLFGERANSHFFMTEEEQSFLNSLPEEVNIYRGCSISEIKSGNYRYSWTLKRKIAEFFANEYLRNDGIESDVVELKVPKSKIFAYINDREEEEVIYRHR